MAFLFAHKTTMNRLQMRTRQQHKLAELIYTEANDNPFTLDDNLDQACSDFATGTRCFAGREQVDIVNNQIEYCGAPTIFAIQAITATWADGSLHRIGTARPEDMDRNSSWRTAPVAGNPTLYIPSGLNRVKLYPVPNFTSLIFAYTDLVIQSNTAQVSSVARPFVAADAVTAPNTPFVINIVGGTGFTPGLYNVLSVAGGIATLDRSCGTAASTGGIGNFSQGGLTVEGLSTCPGTLWPNDTDDCPLPMADISHEAVILGACITRITEFPQGDNLARLKMIQPKYDQLRGKMERIVNTQVRAMRNH